MSSHPTRRQLAALAEISPAVIDEILDQVPSKSTRLWIGITGRKQPNFAFEIGGRVIRQTLSGSILGAGAFNPSRSVEIDPKTGRFKAPSTPRGA